MQTEQILTNARVVLADEVINGTVVIRDGKIADVSAGKSQLPAAQDCLCEYLMPVSSSCIRTTWSDA